MKGDKKIIDILNTLLAGELTAVDQYLIHGEMYADMGLGQLAEKALHESEHERLHARALIQRILFLEGKPNLAKREALDARIQASSTNWRVARMSLVDRNILRLGAYELTHRIETPYRVVINEAIELAKSFGGTDGHRYINGVLDKFAPTVRAAEVEHAAKQRNR